jgi:hypothetical protein
LVIQALGIRVLLWVFDSMALKVQVLNLKLEALLLMLLITSYSQCQSPALKV